MVRDRAPFRQLPSHLNYFVNNQNEFLELLSLCFVALYPSVSLREQKVRKFNSKDFASDERKIEIEIVNYSVSHKKRQPCAIEEKKRLHHMLVNWSLRARIEDGKKLNIPIKTLAPAVTGEL